MWSPRYGKVLVFWHLATTVAYGSYAAQAGHAIIAARLYVPGD